MPGVLLHAWDDTNGVWIPLQVDANGLLKVDMANISLGDLGDVSVASPSDGYVLYWDNATSLWKAKAVAAGGLTAQLTNKAGAATVEGYVYRLDPDNNDSFDYASEDEDAQVAVATGVIADNAAGAMVIGGYEDIYVDGDTTRGQFLYFSSTNGQAKPLWAREDGAFAEATASRSGAGLVKAYVFPRERIRKYAMKDEESWQNHYLLPLSGVVATPGVSDWARYAGNPILTKTGTGWEANWLFGQCIIYYEGTYYLYYVANGTWDARTVTQIGVASSASIYGPYTRCVSNPIVSVSTNIAHWDYKNVAAPSVVYDQWESDSAKRFKMVFCGQNNASDTVIGYAYAAAPLGPWTKYATNPVIASAATNATTSSLIRMGRKFYVYTCFTSALKYYARLYEGSDLTSLTVYGTVLSPGAGGTWDDAGIFYFSIFWNLGIFYILYSGYDGADARIGMATSFDGRTFTKWPHNPILGKGTATEWDDTWVIFPTLIRVGKTYYLLYTGYDGTADYSIGIAEMS